jgi:uncharacterized membrane protein
LGGKGLIFKVLVVLLFAILAMPKGAIADTQVESQSLTLTAYLDGFVEVKQDLELQQSTLQVNVSLLGENRQNLLVTDEDNLPVDYSLYGNTAVVFSVGASRVSVSYLTQDLTSKIGEYWTLKANYAEHQLIQLPKNALIISINAVPDSIENRGEYLAITMPAGDVEVTYTIEHETGGANSAFNLETWELAAIISVSVLIPIAIVGIKLLKNKKKSKPKKTLERSDEVDVEKILTRHRELRQDEIQVIRFLASRQGKAFEAELFELLNLPRTTTWRLIRRLQSMEIVDVKKSRRQNIVLIRDKYLKTTEKK